MVKVVPVNLPFNVKTLWFDPADIELRVGDQVVVQTKNGNVIGCVSGSIFEATEKRIKSLKAPLQPVLRIATDEDLERAEEMKRLSEEAMPIFKEFARETNEDMHPVSVEYMLEGDRAIFYFEAEGRIDFRDLVRRLASEFHVRVDMRQIGVRDEARIVGGLAHCGQEVCCARLGGEFCPVSIRMAKDQGLSLNPQKVSGLCGRLMCCLRYENEAYRDFNSRAPKIGAKVETPEGEAKVIGLDVPKETVKLQIPDEKPVNIPLSAFEEPEEGARPSVVGEEAWFEAKEREQAEIAAAFSALGAAQLTGTDKLGDARAIHHEKPHKESRRERESRREDGRTPRRRRRSQPSAKEEEKLSSRTDPARKPRKRRSKKISGGSEAQGDQKERTKRARSQEKGDAATQPIGHSQAGRDKPRPGQKSSGLSSGQAGKSQDGKPHKRKRRSRNRRRKTSNGQE